VLLEFDKGEAPSGTAVLLDATFGGPRASLDARGSLEGRALGSSASMASRISSASFCWQNGLVSCRGGLERTTSTTKTFGGMVSATSEHVITRSGADGEQRVSLPLEERAPRLVRTKVSRGAATNTPRDVHAEAKPTAVEPPVLQLVGSRWAGTVEELCPRRGARILLGMGLEGWLPGAGDLGFRIGEHLEGLEVTEVQVLPHAAATPKLLLRYNANQFVQSRSAVWGKPSTNSHIRLAGSRTARI